MISYTPLFVAIPISVAFLIVLASWKFDWLADILGSLTSFALFVLSVLHFGTRGIYIIGGWDAPVGINFISDGLSSLMLLIINLISFSATIFSISYMKRYTAKYKYYSLFLLMVAGMNGVVLTGDMFNLFVFLEIASIASYALVGFGCEHDELEASFKYLILGNIGSTFVLFGVVLLYSMTGFLTMSNISISLAKIGNSLLYIFVFVLFLVGFGIKAALVPFHPWLPDAHPSAPAPISAMLSGVLIKTLGFYCIVRVFFNVFGLTSISGLILIVLGLLSMTVGVFLAVGQWDFKRLLAYHSISQMGYVILGIGLGAYILSINGPVLIANLAILGGIFHLCNHSIFKSLLFLCSGSVEYSTGTRELKKMGGLGEKMPVTGLTCTIASLSIAGVPPFNGFWSKLLIIIATIQASVIKPSFISLTIITILVSFVTLISFLKILKYTFLGTIPDNLKTIRESPFPMKFSMIFLAIFCIFMGVLLIPVLKERILLPSVDVLISGIDYAKKIITGL